MTYWDVFLGDISFYLVVKFVSSFSRRSSSFSRRSYPPVRKCTDHCGKNMSTNMASKTRTTFYSYDQSVRTCNHRLVVNTMNKKSVYFRTEWYLLCYFCCVKHPANRNSKSRVYTRCSARIRNHRREATLPLLLVLQSGAAVVVVWAHARAQELCL